MGRAVPTCPGEPEPSRPGSTAPTASWPELMRTRVGSSAATTVLAAAVRGGRGSQLERRLGLLSNGRRVRGLADGCLPSGLAGPGACGVGRRSGAAVDSGEESSVGLSWAAGRVITRCITRSPVSSAQLKVSHRELAAVEEMGVPDQRGFVECGASFSTSLAPRPSLGETLRVRKRPASLCCRGVPMVAVSQRRTDPAAIPWRDSGASHAGSPAAPECHRPGGRASNSRG
jgi:hypothetical protein